MNRTTLDIKGLFFIIFLILLAALMWQMMSPFLSIILVALIMVEMLYPLHRRIKVITGHEGIAGIISTLFTLLVVVIPLIILSLLIISEITKITETRNIPEWISLTESAVNSIITNINTFLANLGIPRENQIAMPNLVEITTVALTQVKAGFLPLTTSIISVSLNTVFYLFLFIITLIYIFTGYERLPQVLSRVSPLDSELDALLFRKFTETIRAVIKGNFLVAIAQASAVSAMMLIMGIGAPVLLWLTMILLSLVPVGSGLVWFPAGLVLIFSGRPVEGVILIVYSAIIINVIDTLLRPYLIKDTVKLHPLIIIFSVIGGIIVFNSPLGIFYGPLIAVFFSSMMAIYNQHFAKTIILDHVEKAD